MTAIANEIVNLHVVLQDIFLLPGLAQHRFMVSPFQYTVLNNRDLELQENTTTMCEK